MQYHALVTKNVSGRRHWRKVIFFLFIVVGVVWFSFTFAAYLDGYSITALDEDLKADAFAQVQTRKAPVLDINELSRKLALLNREEKIYNEAEYGALDNDSLVIVVQVHDRISYLKYLVASLSVAKEISKVLLIFSHDFFDEEIDALIKTIDFCKVIQIFYPYSIQMYPNDFPGSDPEDCSPGTTKAEALERSCRNVFYTDNRGHYRNPSAVQVKHHWWWKANRVFDLAALRAYDGLVMFLEEDLFLIDDFIAVLELMRKAAQRSCETCKVFSLASNVEAIYLDRADSTKYNKATVTSHFSNMGLSFTRAVWAEMVDCHRAFCLYDEYNWDYALQHVFTSCMNNAAAVTLDFPRVFHLGTCGMHFKSADCDPSEAVSQIHRILTKVRRDLYPDSITLSFNIDHSQSNEPTGGWGDPRDQAFCLGMTIK